MDLVRNPVQATLQSQSKQKAFFSLYIFGIAGPSDPRLRGTCSKCKWIMDKDF